MDLKSTISNYFSSAAKKNGRALFTKQKIRILAYDPGRIQFLIDKLDASTQFTWKEVNQKTGIEIACSCYQFKSGSACKHIWASILEAEEFDVMPELNENSSISFKSDYKIPPNFMELLSRGVELEYINKGVRESVPLKNWQKAFERNKTISDPKENTSGISRQVYFAIDTDWLNYPEGNLDIYLMYKKVKNGIFKEDEFYRGNYSSSDLKHYKDLVDKELISTMMGFIDNRGYGWRYENVCNIPKQLERRMIKRLTSLGRLVYVNDLFEKKMKVRPISMKEGDYSSHLKIGQEEKGLSLSLDFYNDDHLVNFKNIYKVSASGLFFGSSFIGSLPEDQIAWPFLLNDLQGKLIPKEDQDHLLAQIYSGEYGLPEKIDWPKDMGWEKKTQIVKPLGKLFVETNSLGAREVITANVFYKYGLQEVSAFNLSEYVVDKENKRLSPRDKSEEEKLFSRLSSHDGFAIPAKKNRDQYNFTIKKSQFTHLVRDFVSEGWEVIAHGKKVKSYVNFPVIVSSGLDWFELKIDTSAQESLGLSLPELIEASKKDDNGFIKLGDGSLAMLPEKWVEKYAILSDMGKLEGEVFKFSKTQGLLLDGFLSDDESVEFDLDFKKFQKQLKTIKLDKQKSPSRSFKGSLRDYQKAGLSWLEYLNEFSLGGVLADDMGLGKTVQVLAFLQKIIKIKSKERLLPNLLVVPKSLVLNWMSEAERFTPNLKVMAYVDENRVLAPEQVFSHDLIIVTYHTLRINYEFFKDQQFNYIILDEAQAIKNSTAQISRVVKKLNANNRLALTGTPVENSIADLFSIMDFTSPGLISSRLKKYFTGSSNLKDVNGAGLTSLNKALAPLILRRKKEDVLKELPEKEVNTLVCDLSKKERKQYDDLKKYYQLNLKKKFKKDGFNKSKIDVLEALLRLRQAACHPGLIDKKQNSFMSAKLESLLEQIENVIGRGHKCLVFSQFTSFLKIAEKSLQEKKIKYSYLDGKTSMKKRQSLVDDFQSSQDQSVFLISLKAGGVGLNLTKADYVFILDPWWNPATEMQAIDRSHRIGQKNKVFAYKLIAKDTVEEKILQLQEKKKGLSDAIINSGEGMLKKLTMDDLNFLLN